MAGPSLADRIRDWRTRQLGKPAFRRFAARFPLTRPTANAAAVELFGHVSGFVRSQTLYACLEIGLLARLRAAPMATASLATALDLPPDAAARLLQAAGALRLVRQGRDGQWRLDDFGAVLLGDPGVQAMIRHHAMLYRDLADPLALLRGRTGESETRHFWSYARSGADPEGSHCAVARYSALMADSQAMIHANVLDAHSFAGTRQLLDVGGGDGAFLEAAARRYPALRISLFDLPAAASLADRRFAASGLAARAQVRGGDFFRDPLPTDSDCALLSRILCDHEDSAALELLRNLHRSMAPGASLLVAEPLADATPAGQAASAYFSMYFQAMGQGRCRTFSDLAALLGAAGFARIRRRRTPSPLLSGLIVASRL